VTKRSLFVSSARIGHAANSSSTHSIILGSSVRTDERWESVSDGEGPPIFGWSDFVLASREAKAQYAAAQIGRGLYRAGFEPEAAELITRSLCGCNDVGEVDHQSQMLFPGHHPGLLGGANCGSIRKPQFHCEFAKEFFGWVVNDDDVVIRGGNDNEPDDIPQIGGSEYAPFEYLRDRGGQLLARKDGDFWTLFNPKTSSTPELVDLKITDFCPFGCSFCYQSSTTSGTHANFSHLEGIAYNLGGIGVFEVALGGGETTMHPDFPQILACFYERGVLPNFTTFSHAWFKKPHIMDAVKKYCGAVAFSVNETNSGSVYDLRHTDFGDVRVSLQIVLGVTPDRVIREVIQDMHSEAFSLPRSLTLLGFKSFGRGNSSQKVHRNDLDSILTAAADAGVAVGMDTAAVQEYLNVLDGRGVHRALLADKEGRFSAYIDAVREVVARDSYSEEVFPFSGGMYRRDLTKVLSEKFPFSGGPTRLSLSVLPESPSI